MYRCACGGAGDGGRFALGRGVPRRTRWLWRRSELMVGMMVLLMHAVARDGLVDLCRFRGGSRFHLALLGS